VNCGWQSREKILGIIKCNLRIQPFKAFFGCVTFKLLLVALLSAVFSISCSRKAGSFFTVNKNQSTVENRRIEVRKQKEVVIKAIEEAPISAEAKSDAVSKVQAVPFAESQTEQENALLEALYLSLKGSGISSAVIGKLLVASTFKMAEVTAKKGEQDSSGNSSALDDESRAKAIGQAVQFLTERNFTEDEILSYVIAAVYSGESLTLEKLEKIMKEEAFAGFKPGVKDRFIEDFNSSSVTVNRDTTPPNMFTFGQFILK